jgi:hypothetical protein
MNHLPFVVFLIGLACAAVMGLAVAADKPAPQGPLVAHNVFFSLKDNSEAAKKAMIDDCHKLLAPIPGTVFYAAGTLSDMKRDVNDRDFDVALHCVFKSQVALDAYLVAPKHLEFVDKHRPNWKKVRVFDSDVSGAPR